MSTTPADKPLIFAAHPAPLRTGRFWSLYGVWFRHIRVYSQTLLANSLPPIMEPLFFFVALAVGLSPHMNATLFDGLPYIAFIASGIVVSSAMATGVFETTYGTFVRLTWQKTYDAMLSTHLTLREVFVGEMLFCATKGAVFSSIVMLVMIPFGTQLTPWCVLVPIIGFATAFLFAAIGLIVTSYVKMINNFSFFWTGVITPLFFFSGTFFPVRTVENDLVWWLWFVLPLSHSVELSRACFKGLFELRLIAHLLMLVIYTIVAYSLAMRRMRQRVFG